MTRKRAFLSILSFATAGILTFLAAGSLASGQATLPERDVRAASANLGTAFTYQGELQHGGSPANGVYDFSFSLHDALTGGAQVGSTVAVHDVAVTGGRFTAVLDFGDTPAVFDGTALWLEIGVREGGSTGAYTILSPRQALTAAPYAIGLRPGAVISGTVGSGSGVLNLSSSRYGLRVNSAREDGVYVFSADEDGVRVRSAGDDGVQVSSAADSGVYVGSAAGDGVFVCSTGDKTGCSPSTESNGVEIGNADHHGVHIAAAFDGVVIDTAAQDGVFVESAENGDGFQINSAGNNGVEVNGAGTYAGYFNGNVRITGSCTGCLQASFGVNVSDRVLQPGDIVTVQGISGSDLEGVPMLMNLAPANPGQAVVGVVHGWAEIGMDEEQDGGETSRQLVPRGTSVAPGEFLSVIIYGPVQVRASAASGDIVAGARVAAAENGQARALRTVTVDGIEMTENAPTLGIALESLDAGAEGMIWVLVNPR